MEEYISHEDYKKMLKGFGKQTPKRKLTEGLEKEGNAFTAGLAKTRHGGSFKVGDKTVKDTSNYDAELEEYQFDQMYPDDPGPFESDDMEEGINSAPMQATGQTIVANESRLAHLTSEEMDQLKQYAESIKTIKEQIMKMVNKKPEMEEGGNMTGLVMKPTTTSEGEDEEEM